MWMPNCGMFLFGGVLCILKVRPVGVKNYKYLITSMVSIIASVSLFDYLVWTRECH